MLIIGNAWSVSMLQADSTVRFRQLTLAEAKEMVAEEAEVEGITSIIGHPGTAEVFSRLLEEELPTNRAFYKMRLGERLLVGSLNTRLPEGRVLSAEELTGLPIQWWLVELIDSPPLPYIGSKT